MCPYLCNNKGTKPRSLVFAISDIHSFISFTLSVIGPVLLLIVIGYLFYRFKVLDDAFVEKASKLIFNFALPALLFVNISASDISALTEPKTIAIGVSATLIIFILYLLWASFMVKHRQDKGVLIQGAFRANMGIIGLAYCANAYGSEGLAYASIYLGCLTIVYNVMSVAVLNIFSAEQIALTGSNKQDPLLLKNKVRVSKSRIGKGIITNPIILSIIAGVMFAYLRIPVPEFALNSLGYFAQLTLPLALLCTGASLRFSNVGSNHQVLSAAVMGKCILYPLVTIALALVFDISGLSLGVIFFMALSPTAAASYVMVRKIGGNHQLAAQIIALTTIASVPVTVLAYFLMLKYTSIA
ncbi:AEC family transporter [Ningiella sp. W23]|uniref:AEC family transporter n=1 Tax=Ningiella sp. W23 TaxID=3023715 RepID=UPI003758043C